MEMTHHRASRYTLVFALLGLPAVAGAQAFGLNEIGSCALARGFATTSSPCDDASSLYWNPGSMPKTRGLSFYGGAAIIKIGGSFQQDTSGRTYEGDVPTSVVPHVFLNYRGAGRLAYGIGAYVPYGLTSQWGDDFPGRFAAKKASLQTVYIQPNVSFQLTDNWSIGGGPIFGHSSVELIQGIDLSQQVARVIPPTPPSTTPTLITFGQLGIPARTEFARASLKGSSNAFGLTLGVHGRLSPTWEMGARFLSQLSFDYNDADATFTPVNTGLTLAANSPFTNPATGAPFPGGTPVDVLLASQFTGGSLVAQKVNTQIRHPAQLQAGFAYTGFERTTVSVDYAYVGWKSFNVLPVNFQGPATSRTLIENYNNTSSFRLGVDHHLVGGAALRAGFTAATSAAPPETVTPLLPEQDRELGMLGVGYPLTRNFAIDATYAHIFTAGRRGRIDERPAGSSVQTALGLNSGTYSLNANIFSFSLKATY
jgi:long-chain fatty acid transport protein